MYVCMSIHVKIFDIITIVTHNEFHSFDGRIVCIQSVRDIDDLRRQFDLVDAGGLGSTHQIADIVLDFPIRTRHLIHKKYISLEMRYSVI